MGYSLYKAEDFAADESFISYYLGTDPAAIAFWENWIRLNPGKLDEIVTAEHLLDLLYVRLPQAEFEAEQRRMQRFLQGHQQESTVQAETGSRLQERTHNTGRWIGALVACCLVVLLALVVRQRMLPGKVTPVEWLSSSNPAGQRSIIQLSDGSKVTLNASSTLFYPKAFTGNARELMLTGEAFFEVAKNPEKPFIVRTGKLTTTVLGTKFNISAPADNSKTQVALVEGSVKVEANGLQGEVILHPSQQVTYTEKDNSLTTSGFVAEELLAWKDNTLHFKNASFAEVAAKLHQAYGIVLLNKSSKQEWSYSGKFQNTDYLTVIKSICFAKRLQYDVRQDTIIFK